MVETPGACRSGARGSCQYQAMPAEAKTVVLRSTWREENVMAFRHFTCVVHHDGVLLVFVFTDSSDLWQLRASCRHSMMLAITFENITPTVWMFLSRWKGVLCGREHGASVFALRHPETRSEVRLCPLPACVASWSSSGLAEEDAGISESFCMVTEVKFDSAVAVAALATRRPCSSGPRGGTLCTPSAW